MGRKGNRKPFVVKNVSDLLSSMLVLSILGCLFLFLVGWFAGKPAIEQCGCGKTVVTTLADRIMGGSVFGTFSLLFFAGCVSFARLRRRVLQSVSEEDLCERFGMDQETLRRLTEERQIQPRFLVADHPHYELSDFGEAGVLLRACSSPTRAEELLRAGGAPDATPPDQLLRAQPDAPNAASTDA